MDEFNETLTKPILPGRDNSSESSGSSWYGTESYEESEKLRRFGDKTAYERIKPIKVKADKIIEQFSSHKIKYTPDIVGFQPIVGNAIMGLPQSMINVEKKRIKSKVIDVFLNISMPASRDKEDLETLGSVVLAGVEALELQGVGVNLNIGKLSGYSGGTTGYMVKMKSSDEQLNTFKFSYYFSNASSLRRTGFRIHEVESRLPDITNSGYGRAAHSDYQNARSLFEGQNLAYFDCTNEFTDPNKIEEYLKKFQEVVDRVYN